MSNISRVFKAAFSRLLGRGHSGHGHDVQSAAFHDQARDFNPRDYELYYWSGAPGPWY